ncbi:MAG: zinc-ribbon domain-containing protein [Gammaproteobacteria bacterium]|nr:zinc-ribbon domain-containing protein [Gammaproteobacteria bacterium]
MYTQCPKCATVFRITAAQLRVAEGEVRCGNCAISFNALSSISDDLPELTDAVLDDDVESQDALPNEEDKQDDEAQLAEQTDGSLEFDAPEVSWSRFFVSPDADEIKESAPDLPIRDQTADIGETAPAEQDPTEELSPLDMETSNQGEWSDFLSDLIAEDRVTVQDETDQGRDEAAAELDENREDDWENVDDATADQPIIVLEHDPTDAEDAAEKHAESSALTEDVETPEPPLVVVDAFPDFDTDYDVVEEHDYASEAAYELTPESRASEFLDLRSDEFPAWVGNESEAADHGDPVERKIPWPTLTTIALLGIALLGQLLHYNRDSLATHPDYGELVRRIYAVLGSPLYPEWRLDAFEVRGTEAVAGRSAASALDILATIEVVSREPVGLPLIRIALHDRWSNPVASRVFFPAEYLGTNADIPATLSSGTAFPIEVSVIDPGTEAQSYVVDICLPNRSRGLQCQLGRDPFQS